MLNLMLGLHKSGLFFQQIFFFWFNCMFSQYVLCMYDLIFVFFCHLITKWVLVHIKRSQQPVSALQCSIFEFSKTKHNYKLKRELSSRFKIQTQTLFLDAVLLYAEIDLTRPTWLIHTSFLPSKWNLYPKIQFLA